MRRNNEGYVLAYVMVVVAIMAAISASVSAIAVRNIQTQEKAVQRMQDQYEAEGEIEKLAAQAVAEVSSLTFENKDEITNKIEEKFTDYGITNCSATIDSETLTCNFTLTETKERETETEREVEGGGKKKFKITTTTVVTSEIELGGKISEKTNGNVKEYAITEPTVTYKSNETAVTTKEVPA